MQTTLVCYVNSDDALLLWSADPLEDHLRGFAIERELKRGRKPAETAWIDHVA